MRRKMFWLMLLAGAVALAGIYGVQTVRANDASGGFKGSTLFTATWDEFDVFNKQLVPASDTDGAASVWLSQQKTKGKSDVYVQTNSWPAGASTGWHTHPGHSLIYVTSGTLTVYDSLNCEQHVYTAGQTFVDHGGDHVHVIRNESGTEAATGYAIQIIPHGAQRRINADPPEACSTIQ
ncbi:MAG TPA: cupin domain-containing protein [Terriglobales bacterium]|nr:cupin domain-containing protein [Terriglobales bacterium]